MIFLRHPKPEVEPGICYGRLDLEIAEEGYGQILDALAKTPTIRHVIASPAKRCRKLAEDLAAAQDATLEFDPRLWEMDMGEWEGRKWSSIDRKRSEFWLEDPINRPTPRGESFADLQKRVHAAVDSVEVEKAMATAIVCHAGPIRAIQMAWKGYSFRQAFDEVPAYAVPMRIVNPLWHR